MSIDLTLVGQFVVFITMLLLMKKMLYVPLNDAMEARAKKIEDGLAAADAGLEAKAAADAAAELQLNDANLKLRKLFPLRISVRQKSKKKQYKRRVWKLLRLWMQARMSWMQK